MKEYKMMFDLYVCMCVCMCVCVIYSDLLCIYGGKKGVYG